eukprot:PITA_35331
MTEREGLAMVYALLKFRHYLLGGNFEMYTNHSALKYLVNKPMLGGKICRWLLLFQKYEFEVIVKPQRLNAGPDHLSRIKTGEEPNNLEEGFDKCVALCGGHHVGKAAMQKILRASLSWLVLHKDSKAYCKACDSCQRIGRPSRRDKLPLHPQVSLQPFEKWVIDFVGAIQPAGKKIEACYIITAMKYLTRWVEVGAMTKKFLFEYVLTRFGYQKVLMID